MNEKATTRPEPRAGEPLPVSLRVRMEALWGEDLSDVRIHVRPEVLTLGAAALTMGTDIWFAPGMYDPTRFEGLRVLGHELAHVRQQRAGRVRPPRGSVGSVVIDEPGLEAEADRLGAHAAHFVLRGLDAPEAPPVVRNRPRTAPGAPRLVQCMPFGVELECSDVQVQQGKHRTQAKKGTVIISDGYLPRKADGKFGQKEDDKSNKARTGTFKVVFEVTSANIDVVEFVAAPPVDSREQLLKTVKNMVRLAEQWDQQLSEKKSIEVGFGMDNWILTKTTMKKPFEGMLQITIGVPLRCLPSMYRLFKCYGNQSQHLRSLALWDSVRREAQANTLGPDGRRLSELHDETWGFLLLVLDYINRAAPADKGKYAKATFDTLARTNFVTIFATLPAQDQARLTVNAAGPRVMRDEWVSWLLSVVEDENGARVPALAPPRPPAKIAKDAKDAKEENFRLTSFASLPVRPWKNLAKTQMLPWIANTKAKDIPTFYDWLKNMPHKDLLAYKKGVEALKGMGAMQNKLDTVRIGGRDEKAPIFELRAPKEVPIAYKDWVATIETFWLNYQQILRPTRLPPARPPLARPPPARPPPPHASQARIHELVSAARQAQQPVPPLSGANPGSPPKGASGAAAVAPFSADASEKGSKR